MKQEFFDTPKIRASFKAELEQEVLKNFSQSMKPFFSLQFLLPLATSATLALLLFFRIQTLETSTPKLSSNLQTFDQELDRLDSMLETDHSLESLIN